MSAKIEFHPSTGKHNLVVNGKSVIGSTNLAFVKRIEAIVNAAGVNTSTSLEDMGEKRIEANVKFNINTRFSFVEKLVTMVCKGIQVSGIITGEGGLGKSYTIMKTLKENNMVDISDVSKFPVGTVLSSNTFIRVKGYSTAKGLYRTLYENNNRVIVLDDCDSVLVDKVALNLLKGALDSYDERIISWNADIKDEDLPRSFNFTGRVIFISNMAKGQFDQALRTRSMMVDLEMTADQKVERMDYIINSSDYLPEVDMDVKRMALEFIANNKNSIADLSLRTLSTVIKLVVAGDNWEEMAEYLTC
jgi:hypothetical protein